MPLFGLGALKPKTMYRFEGVEFTDISGEDLPADIKALYIKECKSTARKINQKPSVKQDKRAERMQYCYNIVLKKGEPNVTPPLIRDYDYRSKIADKLAGYLEVQQGDVAVYLEPLRAVLTMF